MSKSSPSFILEFPLAVFLQEEKEMETRFEAARYLFNACLGESLKRLYRMKQSKQWKEARCLTKSQKKKLQAKALYKEAKKRYAFSEYDVHHFAGKIAKRCFIKNHLDSLTIQKEASSAFQSVKEYAYGKRGKPRFRGKGRQKSVEGKTNSSGIRFKDRGICWNIKKGSSLKLNILFDPKDKDGLQEYGLSCKTKYVRLVWRKVRSKKRWYVQLVQEGLPLQKAKHSKTNGVVGLDIGPSSLAASSENNAFLVAFCSEIEDKSKEIKALQRKMERSRCKTNPQNYKTDGTIQKGSKKWTFSRRYLKLKDTLLEKQRCLSEYRKCQHGRLANRVFSLGHKIRLEKLSYKSFQKNYGGSVSVRAPGMFVSILRRKAESAGGLIEEFSPYKTALSQICQCGSVKKKQLSERWHSCDCGVQAQRDLYSAYLARFVEQDHLDISQVQKHWAATEPLLERAISRLCQQASGGIKLSSFGLNQRQSLSHAKGCLCKVETGDVVGKNPRAAERPYNRN